MTPVHKPHRKPVIAQKVNRPSVWRKVIRLNNIFIKIELERKQKKQEGGKN